MIKVSYFTDEVSDDLEESARLGAEAGATHVDLRHKIFGSSTWNINDDSLWNKARDIFSRYNLKTACVAGGFGGGVLPGEDFQVQRDNLRRLIRGCHILDAKTIRMHILLNPNRKGLARPHQKPVGEIRPDPDEYRDCIAETFFPAVKLVKEEGINLGIETEGVTLAGTCAETAKILSWFENYKSIGVCWDIKNSFLEGELPYPDGYEKIKERIVHIHVKASDNYDLAQIGTFNMSYKELFRIIINDGYNGAAAIEHWGDKEKTLSGIRQLREVVDSL